MKIGRREFLGSAGVSIVAAVGLADAQSAKGGVMFGLIGKMTTVAGKRDALIAILLNGTSEMPGCLSYIVAKDPAAANAIWITEVWDSEASHKASLNLPEVKKAISLGKPLIASFASHTTTEPVGGIGLKLRTDAKT